MSTDKKVKAFLVGFAALCTAITANDFFSQRDRAIAGVIGATAAALLAYLLKPTETDDPQEVTGPGGGPVETTETNP